MRTQRQVKDLREPSLMETHMTEYQRFHEDYQNTQEESVHAKAGSSSRRRRDTSESQQDAPKNRTNSHSVREFIKFELSDAKVPDKETEIFIQKQRALKQTTIPKNKSERMTGSESQQVMVTEHRYGSVRSGRSPARYEVYNQNSATKTPFKIVVPDGKPMQYKVYGSSSYNYPRYQQQLHQYSVQDTRNYYDGKANQRGFRNGKKLSDYPNKQWWLPIKKQRKRPQQQKLEQYSEQYDEPQDVSAKNQYITIQGHQLPTSYMIQGIGSTPSPAPKFAAVIYKESPNYYYPQTQPQTQTPKPITEDHARYYVNPYGHPVRVEDVQIQTSEPDKHLGTKNEYVPIRDRKVPFKQQYAPETSTQASISALSSLIGKRPIQQLQGLTQLLDLDRPQDSTSPVQFDLEEPTTQLPPPARVYQSTTVSPRPRLENVNIQFYQPKYETVVESKPLSSLSQQQLNAVYNDLVQRHRNQGQRNAQVVSTTVRPQYYQYTTPQPIQVSHSSVTVQTPSDVPYVPASHNKALLATSASYNGNSHRRPSTGTQGYPPASASVAITSTSFHGREEDKVSTDRNRHISHKKSFLKLPGFKARKTHSHELTKTRPTATRHNIFKRDLLRTRPKRRLTRQGLLVRPSGLTLPPPTPPTTKVPIINPYEHDLFTISVDDFANAFDPKGLKEAYDLIGNQDIPTNPFATAPAEGRQTDFFELEDLDVDDKAPSYLRQTVLNLREKNNDFLKTINAAIMYNDRNEEKAYQESARKNGKSLKSGSMRKFDANLNDNGSEEVEMEKEELKPSMVQSKLMSTLRNYIRRDPVKEQLLREVAAQIERQNQQEQSELEVQEEETKPQPTGPVKRPGPQYYQSRRRTKRSSGFLPFHNESTPSLGKIHVYTKTLTDPEGIHYNGSHSSDHSFDYNEDFVEEENATLSVDYEDFSDIRVKNLTNGIAPRSDYFYGDDVDGDSVNDYYTDDNIYYHDRPTHTILDNHHSESRYPSPYNTVVSPSYGHKPGPKFKLVPVTVFKKVPIDPDQDESLHIDNVNIFEGSLHGSGYRGRPRRPPKKYNKTRWHSKRRRYRYRKPSYRRRGHTSHSKLRKRFPKIKWLLEH